MKFTKTAAAATVGLGALIAAMAYSTSSTAVAQTPAPVSKTTTTTTTTPNAAAPVPAAKASVPTASTTTTTTTTTTTAPAPKAAAPVASATKAASPAASAASNIPRHAGRYVGDKVDVQTYTPSCPVFAIGMDAAAIQESSSRSYVENEARRFEGVREQWDAYEDCLTENARRDIEVIRNKLGDTLSAAAAAEAATFNAMNTAATSNVERIGKLPALKAPKVARGAPVAAPAAPAVSTLSAWTTPTGRFVGTLIGGAENPEYRTGCPDAMGGLTPAAFALETTREGFSRLLDELRAKPDRINQVRTCRQENGQNDYEAIQKTVQDGVNAVFVPRKSAFEREFAAVRFQLTEHRKPGGLMAPPEMGRAKAKAPVAKSKAKKK